MIQLKSNPNQVFKNRVIEVKENLPKDWQNIVIKHYPKYDTKKGYHLMRNVYRLQSADVQLTEIMEKIANKELI